MYCTGSAMSPRYLPSHRSVVPVLFPCVRVNTEYRQQRLHVQTRDASFALAHRRISHFSTLGDQHTAYQDFNFPSIQVTFFPVACITLRQKQCSIFTRHGLVSPVTAVAMPEATMCSRVPATNPQIFPQDPALVDVCALLDDADPMRCYR